MYLRDFARGLLRRWYVVVVGLLLTVAAAFWAYSTTPVRYDAQASLVLLPPSSVVGDDGNPYLNLQGLGQALEILGQRMMSESEQATIAKAYPGTTYTVGPDTSSTGPLLVITTDSGSAPVALSLLTTLRGEASDTLAAMQSELNVSTDARIGITDVTVDESATVASKARTQLTVIVLAVGIALSVLITAVVDRALAARRRRLAARAATTEGGGHEPTDRLDSTHRADRVGPSDKTAPSTPTTVGADERKPVGASLNARAASRRGGRRQSSRWPRGASQSVD